MLCDEIILSIKSPHKNVDGPYVVVHMFTRGVLPHR